MNLRNYLAILSLSSAIVMSAHANHVNPANFRVPFYNAPMHPAEDLYIDYTLEAGSAMRCKITSGDSMADIRWEYRGIQYKAQLPLSLKESGTREAQLADAQGTLIISTLAGYNDGITVTCDYVSHQNA